MGGGEKNEREMEERGQERGGNPRKMEGMLKVQA